MWDCHFGSQSGLPFWQPLDCQSGIQIPCHVGRMISLAMTISILRNVDENTHVFLLSPPQAEGPIIVINDLHLLYPDYTVSSLYVKQYNRKIKIKLTAILAARAACHFGSRLPLGSLTCTYGYLLLRKPYRKINSIHRTSSILFIITIIKSHPTSPYRVCTECQLLPVQ